jgi:hypothetical protein
MAAGLFEDVRVSGAQFREADVAMKMFGTMMGAYLSHLSSGPDHPAFLPSAGLLLHVWVTQSGHHLSKRADR